MRHSQPQRTISSQLDDFPAWYADVLAGGQLVDAAPVRGCSVLRPGGMSMWEGIQRSLDARIKATGASNVYLPLLIPQSFFEKEAAHVHGFATECAVVTHHRLKATSDGGMQPDPAARLQEPLVIRPTSETLMWNSFGRWIHSHADLPLAVNQWANVLRWEMHTRPFLRTSEFLWQEGHTAHAHEAEARRTAACMAAVYSDFADGELALAVVPGAKPEGERFAGAEETFTIEGMMRNGWALQCGTSHFLGTNFSRAFGVQYADEGGAPQWVWSTSWGVSTRMIGAVIMSHSDEVGLVMPPPLARHQAVILAIAPSAAKAKKTGVTQEDVLAAAAAVQAAAAGDIATISDGGTAACPIAAAAAAGHALHEGLSPRMRARSTLDARVGTPPGPRFFEWERKGVPLRITVGAGEVASSTLSAKLRAGGRTMSVAVPGGLRPGTQLDAAVQSLLAETVCAPQHSAHLYDAAFSRRRARTYACSSLEEVEAHLRALGVHPEQDDTPEASAASTPKWGGEHAIAGVPSELSSSIAGHRGVPALEGDGVAAVAPLGWYLVPWADCAASEKALQARTRLTVRCFPAAMNSTSPLRRRQLWERPAQLGGGALLPPLSVEDLQAADAELEQTLLAQPCIMSGGKATHVALLGRSY